MNNKKHNKRINYSNSLKVAVILLGTMGRCINAGGYYSESSNTSNLVRELTGDTVSTMKECLYAALSKEEKSKAKKFEEALRKYHARFEKKTLTEHRKSAEKALKEYRKSAEKALRKCMEGGALRELKAVRREYKIVCTAYLYLRS